MCSYDENAIGIYTNDNNNNQVGHVPRDIASYLSPLLDSNQIRLESVGGIKTKPCAEMVQIVSLQTNVHFPDGLKDSFCNMPYDMNRYIFSD